MLSIVGIGHAVPRTVITDDFIREISGGAADGSAPRARRSVLPESYLRETGNRVPFESRSLEIENPTVLGVQAVEAALRRASLTKEQIGLVIADCATPLQTTPSEAQRIAGALGVKVDAYDVTAGTAFFAVICELLSSWKEERIPEYVLCVSTSTPTRVINYRAGDARWIFGDGAGAAIFSTRHHGKLAVREASVEGNAAGQDSPFFELYGEASLPSSVLPSSERAMSDLLKRALALGKTSSGRIIFAGNGFDLSSEQAVCRNHGIRAENHWHAHDRYGHMLGTTPFSLLSEHWDEVGAGDRIVVTLCGVGLSSGFTALEGV